MHYTLESLREGALFLVDKPLDWTSFDVVNKIRFNIKKAYGVKKFKVGHAGTLDPKATGLLIICVGKFTKKIEEYQAQEKVYTGIIKIGATTESYDAEKPENAIYPTEHITEKLIEETRKKFIGEIEQYPPLHSAVKVKGKRLYQMARAGESVKIQSRKIIIKDFEITRIQMPFLHFRVVCSKGTYIRSLAHDYGRALGSGAYLTALRRVGIGTFSVEDANNEVLQQDYFKFSG